MTCIKAIDHNFTLKLAYVISQSYLQKVNSTIKLTFLGTLQILDDGSLPVRSFCTHQITHLSDICGHTD